MKGHRPNKCWKLKPKLKPVGANEMANVRSCLGQAIAKRPLGGDKKFWKAKVAKLKVKMVVMSATMEGGGISSIEI